MKIKVRVPHWVHTEDTGVIILFAFLRKVKYKYHEFDGPLDMYGYDIRKILDTETKYLHDYIQDQVDSKYCTIGKLNREHYLFDMKGTRQKTNIVEISEPKYLYRWAYLMGCTNWNLIEEGTGLLTDRPAYTPMYRMERDLFEYTDRQD
jgi:hypothetical protein